MKIIHGNLVPNKIRIIVILLLSASIVEIFADDPYIDIPFTRRKIKTSADRIASHGYPVESHFVETSDGYVLNIFRIPYSPQLQNQNIKSKPIVLLQHGFFSSSDCFLLNGPNDALAYNFVDRGFDVWLGNARGNVYSRNNTKISLKHPKFWNFSWHEMGIIDIPQTIDYILERVDGEQLHYVGHSQGGTVFFVMTAERPEYNEKIKSSHLLAPPVFLGNATDSFLVDLAPYIGVPDSIYADLFSNQEFIPYNPLVQWILSSACGTNAKLPKYCKLLFLLMNGPNTGNLNVTLLPQLAETHPAGVSTNQAIHFNQLYVSNEFRQFDHGRKNMQYYGQSTPPDYPLEKITANLYIYYSLADGTANALDIQRLLHNFPNLRHFYEMPDPTWSHLDFIFAMQVKEIINDPIIQYCLQYEEGE